MEKTSCRGVFGYLFGHKFTGRFNREDITSPKVSDAMSSALKQLLVQGSYVTFMEDKIEAITNGLRGMNSVKHTYVYDVCTRCGHIIQKS